MFDAENIIKRKGYKKKWEGDAFRLYYTEYIYYLKKRKTMKRKREKKRENIGN